MYQSNSDLVEWRCLVVSLATNCLLRDDLEPNSPAMSPKAAVPHLLSHIKSNQSGDTVSDVCFRHHRNDSSCHVRLHHGPASGSLLLRFVSHLVDSIRATCSNDRAFWYCWLLRQFDLHAKISIHSYVADLESIFLRIQPETADD